MKNPIVADQTIHFDRLRALSVGAKVTAYTLGDHEDILYSIKRHDPEMCELIVNRHLTRHRMEKDVLIQRYPEYFV